MSSYRVIVIGGGGAGVPFAARLAEYDGVDVLLMEAGPAWSSADEAPAVLADALRNASTVVRSMPGSPLAWTYATQLFPGRGHQVARGRLLGGSTAVNGAYFMRAHPDDFAEWAAIAGQEWTYESALPALRRLERDLDFPDDPRHGSDGPVPVSRPSQDDAITRAFLDASVEREHPVQPDKNGDGASGVGTLPLNILGGERWGTARAYLAGRRRPQLTVEGGVRVRRVLFRGARAVGVEVGERGALRREYADEVVISAGAFETPRLLMRSGVGAASQPQIRESWVVDLPGVGQGLSDHPTVTIDWVPRDAVVEPRSRASWTAALNFSAPGGSDRGDLELLLAVMPTSYILSGAFEGGSIGLRVALQTPESRGVVHAEDEAVAVSYDYLRTAHDRVRFRHGLREGLRLLRSRSFARIAAEVNAPITELLRDDAFADDWIREHLGTSLHASGTARIGVAVDREAVTDSHGRVFGTERLRVVDTSLLPTVPSRGTAATAVFLGERLAELWVAEQRS